MNSGKYGSILAGTLAFASLVHEGPLIWDMVVARNDIAETYLQERRLCVWDAMRENRKNFEEFCGVEVDSRRCFATKLSYQTLVEQSRSVSCQQAEEAHDIARQRGFLIAREALEKSLVARLIPYRSEILEE